MAKPKHIYVIDTCVVLHDPMALYKFGENDIYLPLAVIDDLDDIKTRPGNISWRLERGTNFTINYLLKVLEIHKISLSEFFIDIDFKP